MALAAVSSTVQRLFLEVCDLHPALSLLKRTFAIAATLTDASSTFLLRRDGLLFANFTFGVRPFVRPMANLYFSLRVSYQVPTYGAIEFVQALHFFDEYTTDTIADWELEHLSAVLQPT
ncbi:hypothetical protein [Achromobacter marplatensis]|uniref:hypothetical protein n=1 Tax=Achromobacter marplatensis TaxID=470868 RepID=UPI003C748AC7